MKSASRISKCLSLGSLRYLEREEIFVLFNVISLAVGTGYWSCGKKIISQQLVIRDGFPRGKAFQKANTVFSISYLHWYFWRYCPLLSLQKVELGLGGRTSMVSLKDPAGCSSRFTAQKKHMYGRGKNSMQLFCLGLILPACRLYNISFLSWEVIINYDYCYSLVVTDE